MKDDSLEDFPIVEISKIAKKESWRKEINRPVYHIHKWWATRLGSVFRAIILYELLGRDGKRTLMEFYNHHDFPDITILDPFMGSGTTLGESIKLGTNAIGCDINPISSFLVKQAFTHVPESSLIETYAVISNNISDTIKYFYQTKHPETEKTIPVLYYFWVKTVTTPNGEVIPLFSKYVFSQNAYPKRKPEAQIFCPDCSNVFSDRYDSLLSNCPRCGNKFNPQVGPVRSNRVTDCNGNTYKIKDLIQNKPLEEKMYALIALDEDGNKIYLPIKETDINLYNEARNRLLSEDLPLPELKIRNGHNTNQVLGYNYSKWRDFFNDRQLLCLGLLLKEILRVQDVKIQEQMLCLFSSTLEYNNMFCSFKGEGTGAVRPIFSNHILKPERAPLENSVWGTEKSSGCFSTLFKSRLLKAKKYLDEPFEIATNNGDCTTDKTFKIVSSNPINLDVNLEYNHNIINKLTVLNGDSSKLPIIDSTIDYVVTDPPYFDFIHYSELSDFFYAWLAPVLRGRYDWFSKTDSSDINEVQDKDPLEFSHSLSLVFQDCFRVLKPEGSLIFSFHHSRSDGWAAICKALVDSGFYVEETYPIHAELMASNAKSSTKEPISIDSILICEKIDNSVINRPLEKDEINRLIQRRFDTMVNAGIQLSMSDKFVIVASVMLMKFSRERMSYHEVKKELDRVQKTM